MTAFQELIQKPSAWLSGENEEGEIVLSCRVRLARNLDKRPFTHGSKPEFLGAIREEIVSALKKTSSMKKTLVIDMDAISESERMVLAELVAAGSEPKLREQGKVAVKGREYVVEDGDILHILANV